MARKKANISAITFIKEFPRKRPGRHAKSYNKKLHEKKKSERTGCLRLHLTKD
jgi:hypothetical protein